MDATTAITSVGPSARAAGAAGRRWVGWVWSGGLLVVLAFLGPPPFPGAHAAHFDGDKLNNRLSNLRWASPAENEADKRRHGRTRGALPGERAIQADQSSDQ